MTEMQYTLDFALDTSLPSMTRTVRSGKVHYESPRSSAPLRRQKITFGRREQRRQDLGPWPILPLIWNRWSAHSVAL